MLLLIDNCDGFAENLVHCPGEPGADGAVRRNDALDVQAAMAMRPLSRASAGSGPWAARRLSD